MLRQLQAQHGRCSICRGLLLNADHQPQSPQQWPQWLTATRKAIRHTAIAPTSGRTDNRAAAHLIHAHCRRLPAAGTAPLPPCEPSGLPTEIYFSVVQRKVLLPNDFQELDEFESHLLDSRSLRTDRQPLRMEVHQDDLNALTRHDYVTEIPCQTT